MADETILTLAADIVTAHVSHNSVATGDLPMLIQSVFGALAALGQEAPVTEEPRTPAVSVRSSIKPDALVCLDCGVKMKMLKRHLATDHGLSPAEYRARWRLAADYPMVAADYSARRKELALSAGLGRKRASDAVATAKREAAAPPASVAPAKARVKRKGADTAPETSKPDKPSAKPKAPRKKLKVAFGAVDGPPVEIPPENVAAGE